jgi:hypothetical protein
MKIIQLRTAMIVGAAMLIASTARAQPITGTLGVDEGDGWYSSFLDVKPSMSFMKGETLVIRLEGDAENIFVRLLPEKSTAKSQEGIDGDSRKVPSNHIVEITLLSDHPNVKQISVHSGHSAWERPLGANNGKIRIVSIERKVAKRTK